MMTELQARILSVYKEFKKICDKHDLRYFATGGTAIGAVRHQGFIPWDDDLDIDMPWDDYQKFIKIAHRELPDTLSFNSGLEEGDGFVFCKIFEKNSTFFISDMLDNPEAFTGVYVDVFPIIGLPRVKKQRQDFEHEFIDIVGQLWQARVLRNPEYDERKLLRKYKHLAGQYDFDDATYVRRGATTQVEEARYPRSWYDSSVEMAFEDTSVFLPRGYDKQLTLRFGDYMKLPPKSQRVAHGNDSLQDLLHPFEDYVNLVNSTDPVLKAYVGIVNHTLVGSRVKLDWFIRETRELQSALDGKTDEIDALHHQLNDIKNQHETLVRRLESLNGIKPSGRLLIKNLKRRLRHATGEK